MKKKSIATELNWHLDPRNLSPCQIALRSLMCQYWYYFLVFFRNHVYGMFERDKHFSHLSGLERELSFRTEMVWVTIVLHHRSTCTKMQIHMLYFYIVKECCFLFLSSYNNVWLTVFDIVNNFFFCTVSCIELHISVK